MLKKERKLPDSWPMMRHTVACPRTTRTFTNVAVDKDGNLVLFEEMVHQHDVYRMKLAGKQKASRRMYWRGAYIGLAT